jgi:hypothetical protein
MPDRPILLNLSDYEHLVSLAWCGVNDGAGSGTGRKGGSLL